MKPSRTPSSRAVLAAAVLAALGTAAQAGPQEWSRIKLYGDVTIAQDSVDQWGPWQEFEPPAAGPVPVTLALQQSARDPYRPLPTAEGPTVTPPLPPEPPVVVTDLLCAAGSLCGYGLKGLLMERPAELGDTDTTTAHMITVLPRGETSAEAVGSLGILSNRVQVRLDPIAGGSSSTTPTLTLTEDYGPYRSADGRIEAAIDVPSNSAVPSYPNLMMSYITRSGSSTSQQVVGFVGRVTSESGMAERATRAERTATYTGFDLHAVSGRSGAVTLGVNFGNGTFTYATTGGIQDYQAQGVIKGSSYVATRFTTANTSGVLQGSFIGPQANGTIGAASVTQNGVLANTVHVTTEGVVPR